MYRIMSFGFKYSRPRDIEVVDVRDMKNPHHNMRLRPMTGKDKDVQDFVKKDALYLHMFDQAAQMLDRTGSVAFGCLGGRHRSVAMAELVAEGMRRSGAEVQVIHRELG
jgi:UPF0042 nucleotide-binding protein